MVLSPSVVFWEKGFRSQPSPASSMSPYSKCVITAVLEKAEVCTKEEPSRGWVKNEMLGEPHKTQGCPKEQPVGEQPHHPWVSWLGTYLAGNVWFTCGDPMQTLGKCYCISSAWSSVTEKGPRLPHPNRATGLILPSGSPSLPQGWQEQAEDQDALPSGCLCRGARS